MSSLTLLNDLSEQIAQAETLIRHGLVVPVSVEVEGHGHIAFRRVRGNWRIVLLESDNCEAVCITDVSVIRKIAIAKALPAFCASLQQERAKVVEQAGQAVTDLKAWLDNGGPR